MKKFYKVCGIVCTVLIVAGSVCVISSMVMGVSFVKLYDKIRNKTNSYSSYKNANIEKNYAFDCWNLDTLTVTVGSGDFTIEESSDDQIHLINRGDENVFEGKVSGKQLDIKQVSANKILSGFRKHSAVLQIPKNFTAKDVNLVVGSGEADCAYLQTGLLTMKVGSGDVDLNQVKADEVDIVSGSGDVDLTLLGREQDYNCKVNAGSGEVCVGNNSYSGVKHNTNHRTEHGSGHDDNQHVSVKSIDVKSGSGEVEIEFQ